jgi:hypothetical protein
MPGNMTIARLPLSQGRYLYVTRRSSLPGTRRITDINWISTNAYKIAECFAGMVDNFWFGVDVTQLNNAQRIEWVGDMILLGVDQADGLKLHQDDPSATFESVRGKQ